MQIFVEMLSGKSLTLDVMADDSIDIVKAKIQILQDIHPKKQRLILDNIQLENTIKGQSYEWSGVERDARLSDFSIPNESTLTLLIVPDCCKGCADKKPMEISDLFSPSPSSPCRPNKDTMDEFNLCPAKLKTLIFYIVQSDYLAEFGPEHKSGGGLLMGPLESIRYTISLLTEHEHFKGLHLTIDEGAKLRKMIAEKFEGQVGDYHSDDEDSNENDNEAIPL